MLTDEHEVDSSTFSSTTKVVSSSSTVSSKVEHFSSISESKSSTFSSTSESSESKTLKSNFIDSHHFDSTENFGSQAIHFPVKEESKEVLPLEISEENGTANGVLPTYEEVVPIEMTQEKEEIVEVVSSPTYERQTSEEVVNIFEKKEAFGSESSLKFTDESFGCLNLKNLNSLLLKYIEIAHDLEDINSGSLIQKDINIQIDEKQLAKLETKYLNQLDALKLLLKEADENGKALSEAIEKLEEEKRQLEDGDRNKDGQIMERDKNCKGLQSKINEIQARLSVFLSQKEVFDSELQRLNTKLIYLRGELNCYQALHQGERLRGTDLMDRIRGREKELSDKIAEKEKEVEEKREQSSIDTTSLEFRVKGEFAARLKMELGLLRKMFEEAMRRNTERFEIEYRSRISELELELGLVASQQENTESLKQLETEVGALQSQISEANERNRGISQDLSQKTVQMQMMEGTFQNKMSETERKIEYLRAENSRTSKMYEEMNRFLILNKVEVGVYDRLITPELERITERHSETFGLIHKEK